MQQLFNFKTEEDIWMEQLFNFKAEEGSISVKYYNAAPFRPNFDLLLAFMHAAVCKNN